MGWPAPPRSPEKTSFFSWPPSSTQISIMAEPRICPASRNLALTPSRQKNNLVVTNRTEALKALLRILHRIEGRGPISSRPLIFSVLPLRLHLLNMRTISKHHLAEIECGLCADHLSPEPFSHQFWNEATVVDVGVSEQNKAEILANGKAGPIDFSSSIFFPPWNIPQSTNHLTGLSPGGLPTLSRSELLPRIPLSFGSILSFSKQLCVF